jgi:hypothetical protein
MIVEDLALALFDAKLKAAAFFPWTDAIKKKVKNELYKQRK